MKVIWLTTLVVFGLAAFTVVAQMDHDMHGSETKGSEMKGSEHKEAMHEHETGSDKVRCALDGMQMKASAMVPMKHGEETMYFCNDAHHEMFMKAPKRYLKHVDLGGHTVTMHVLTVKEYKQMMASMGMEKMAKVKDPNATHYLSVHLAKEVPVEIQGVVAKVTAADGQASFHELSYDKMMKSYTGNLSLLKAGKHRISLLFASSEVEL